MKTAMEAGFHMPAEWGPHSRCWMAWPCFQDLWGEGLDAAQAGYAAVARAISDFEPVGMLAPPEVVDQARAQGGATVDMLAVDLDD